MKGRTVQIPGVLLTIAQACHRNLTPPSAFPLQAGGGIATLCPRAGLSPAGPARRKPIPSFSESLDKPLHTALQAASDRNHEYEFRKSVVQGTSVSLRVVLGCRRIMKKTNKETR